MRKFWLSNWIKIKKNKKKKYKMLIFYKEMKKLKIRYCKEKNSFK